jgi:hypothetical protein
MATPQQFAEMNRRNENDPTYACNPLAAGEKLFL